MPICEKCEKQAKELFKVMYMHGEDLYVCQDCYDYECMRGDMEYERQKEEGMLDNPDHERDKKEE
jgi:ribosome-binding protein aMBF1 (putative translation factor)